MLTQVAVTIDSNTLADNIWLSLLVTGVVCFLAGLALGYFIWAERKSEKMAKKRLTQVQLLSAGLFVVYIFSPILGLSEPSPIIAIGLISLIGGEAFGVIFAKLVDKYIGADDKRSKK